MGRLITGALALGGPVAYGVVAGQLAHGSFAALGALAIGHLVDPRGRVLLVDDRGQVSRVRQGSRLVGGGAAGLVVTGAAVGGVWLGGRGFGGGAGVVLLAAIAAVIGGFNRWLADATARFITFLVLATGLAGAGVWEVGRWFTLGVLWALLLTLAVQPVVHVPGPAPTYRQLWRRWKGNLTRLEGWRYAIILVPPLAIAMAIGGWWHHERAYWIALAVVIVVRRRGDSLLRATQRCLGTCAGVLIGAALILWVPPSWAIVAVVTVLAGLRPLLKERNYAAYATIMTPLVVLLLDLGRTPDLSTVGYRLIDTVLGCLLAIIPTLVLRRRDVA
ncbi:FUSC family protein [Kribbella solani]|uniref:FUSC family protein n=1 Tax=Kribbella solani TaxID=236067 RepID=UPI0029A55052|nr:FUSC family protein [Kribbella solani]MDX3003803.1 FUSC family protein [Kribbella solani]